MKNTLLKHAGLITFSLLALFGLSSCLEESTVVKVNKDGTGIIHIRKYEKISAGSIFGNSEDEEKKEPKTPNQKDLEAMAKFMGEGVSLKSVQAGKNKSGWEGYEVIFTFKDINSLKIALGSRIPDNPEKKKKNKEPQFVTFEMKGDALKIKTPDLNRAQDTAAEKEDGSGAKDPFGEDLEGAQRAALMARMFAGAKMGFFVEVDGGIAETDAKHRNDNLITIMKIDLGKLLADFELLTNMKKAEGGTREEKQKAADTTDGYDLDLQETITVQLK